MSIESRRQHICIAVLPFENLSFNRDDDYFSRGFTEDLITELCHFNNLQVISSYTSRKIGPEKRDEAEAARELEIDYLLKGSIRRSDGRIRINAQLFVPGEGRVIWAGRYDVEGESILEIQDEIVEKVSGTISMEIDKALLTVARKKPITSLAAYDCWLRGMDRMRVGTTQADLEARDIFNQALEIDPNYSRAYAGLSLSHFNDWSCQLWERWEENERMAHSYAVKAARLDDTDHVVQMILGRIMLYRHEYDLAEQHLNRSLALNSNDADALVQISSSFAFLGKTEAAEDLFHKALRLNPYRNIWYYPYGAFIHFIQRRYDECIETALKGPLTEVWIDLPVFVAAAYAYTERQKKAAHYRDIFLKIFTEKITTGRVPGEGEIVAWMRKANPFRLEHDTDHMIFGFELAGGKHAAPNGEKHSKATPGLPLRNISEKNRFLKEGGVWRMTFEGTTTQLPELKGFVDIAQLLAKPGDEIHCTDLMGVPDALGQSEEVMDRKARASYEERIRELQEDLREAEEMNDLGRREMLETELNRLTEHLSKSLGIGKRTRKLNAPADKARAAVTWRIRSAIKKINASHPALGRHLSNAIQTGAFCRYFPEKEQIWQV